MLPRRQLEEAARSNIRQPELTEIAQFSDLLGISRPSSTNRNNGQPSKAILPVSTQLSETGDEDEITVPQIKLPRGPKAFEGSKTFEDHKAAFRESFQDSHENSVGLDYDFRCGHLLNLILFVVKKPIQMPEGQHMEDNFFFLS